MAIRTIDNGMGGGTVREILNSNFDALNAKDVAQDASVNQRFEQMSAYVQQVVAQQTKVWWADQKISDTSNDQMMPTFAGVTLKGASGSVTLTIDGNGNLQVGGGMYATSFISAYGSSAGGGGGGGGASVSPSSWTTQAAFTSSLALASNLGWDLHSRVTTLENATKPAYDWSEITGKPSSMPASDVYQWAKESVKPSYTTSEVSEGTNLYFTNARAQSALSGHTSATNNPHSVTKAQVGLGNVENTALSTWAGTSNITTLGTITTGTWHGSKIANDYLENSKMTLWGNEVSLGGTTNGAIVIKNGDKQVTMSVDVNGYLKVDGGMYATSFISAYGLNDSAKFNKIEIGEATLHSVWDDEEDENTLHLTSDIVKVNGMLKTSAINAGLNITTATTMKCATLQIGTNTMTAAIAKKLIDYANQHL